MAKNGNRKHGRNKVYCNRYRLEGRREKSKANKLARHLFYQPADPLAKAAWDKLPENARKEGNRLTAMLEENRGRLAESG